VSFAVTGSARASHGDALMTTGLSLHQSQSQYDAHLWVVVLAGGEGTRLRDYVRGRLGHELPKQYCAFSGGRTMLQHTLDRARRFAPPSRIVTIVGPTHREIALPQLEENCTHLLSPPVNRDTAPGLYLPLAYIRAWDPQARVIVFPADHYIAPELAFASTLGEALRHTTAFPEAIVALGVEPAEPEPDFGYILLDGDVAGGGARRVRGFIEKPDASVAAALCGHDALWNTLILCARVSALWEVGRRTQPEMMAALEAFAPHIDTAREHDGVRALCDAIPSINLSRDLLERVPERLLALAMTGVVWSDWGRGERIEATLAGPGQARRPGPTPRRAHDRPVGELVAAPGRA
jgi:mannose-1-phosphate guanylyltransferase